MKLSTWRPKLLTWLQSKITVHSWVLDRPDDLATTVGFLAPLRDVEYKITNLGQCQLTATQDFTVLKRFSEDVGFKDLPVATLEGQYATLSIRLLHDYKVIDQDVLDADFEPVATPTKLTKLGDNMSDWVLEMMWSLRVTVLVDPETGSIEQPYTVNQITTRVWRDNLADDTMDGVSDPDKRVLDFTWVVS